MFFFPNHGHSGLGPTPSGSASKEQSATRRSGRAVSADGGEGGKILRFYTD